MNKIKVLASGKSELRCSYIFPKEQKLFKILRQILMDFDIDSFYLDYLESKKSIKTSIDVRDEFTDTPHNKYLIEIIFGKDKVFLTIFTKSDRQKEISKIINKYTK